MEIKALLTQQPTLARLASFLVTQRAGAIVWAKDQNRVQGAFFVRICPTCIRRSLGQGFLLRKNIYIHIYSFLAKTLDLATFVYMWGKSVQKMHLVLDFGPSPTLCSLLARLPKMRLTQLICFVLYSLCCMLCRMFRGGIFYYFYVHPGQERRYSLKKKRYFAKKSCLFHRFPNVKNKLKTPQKSVSRPSSFGVPPRPRRIPTVERLFFSSES